jgi:hypothetical protein
MARKSVEIHSHLEYLQRRKAVLDELIRSLEQYIELEQGQLTVVHRKPPSHRRVIWRQMAS